MREADVGQNPTFLLRFLFIYFLRFLLMLPCVLAPRVLLFIFENSLFYILMSKAYSRINMFRCVYLHVCLKRDADPSRLIPAPVGHGVVGKANVVLR